MIELRTPTMILAGLLVAAALGELLAAALFRRVLLAWRPPEPAEDELPKVTLLVGLRGADPFLKESLPKFFRQDYPNYEVRIVVDSREDPAWAVAEKAIAECGATHVSLEAFRAEPENGLLNCTTSKVVQAARGAGEDCQVWAMADADLVPHPRWLRELVGPLVADERCGATFGNRWFRPGDRRLGSLVRYAWNAVAVMAMYLWGMPWGGCFAIRVSAVRRGNLLEKWARSVAIDAAAHGDLKKQGLSLKFVPNLLVINRETCGLPFALNFIRRQLTWTRLYHGNWPGAVLIALVIVAVDGAILGLGVCSLVTGSWAVLAWLAGGFAVFLAGALAALALLETTVARITRTREERAGLFSPAGLVRFSLVVPLAFVMHAVAVFQATFMRRVKWRGLTLEVRGPHDIEVIEEIRMLDTSQQAPEENVSI